MKPDAKQDLIERLQNQLDDSLQAKTVQFTGAHVSVWWPSFPPLYISNWPHIIIKKLNLPPVYDSTSKDRSIAYMDALLHANGYYTPAISDTVTIKTVSKVKWIKAVNIRGKAWRNKEYLLVL